MNPRRPLLLARFDGPLARFLRSLRPEIPPDPWPEEVDAAVRSPEAVPLCIDCLYPQEHHHWFCPHCGKPTGDFVVWMPYLQNFAIGELFRKGVLGPPERKTGVWIFLVACSLLEYTLFAPAYWFWMLRRTRGRPICTEQRKEIEFEEIA